MINQLISPKKIQEEVSHLGKQIERDYANKNLLIACILKGAFVFCSDLIRYLSLPHTVDFIIASSYKGMQTSQNVQITKTLEGNLSNKDVLIVEDILDTGHTLKCITDSLIESTASLRICCLLDKSARREIIIEPNYVGFEVEDQFLVGYGIDLNEQYRNLPYIGVVND